MSKFKNSMDKIILNENDKRKMLNNILNHKEKRNFSLRRLALVACTFIIAFSLTIGTGYALIKYFKLDNKIKQLFDVDDEVAEKIYGTDVNIKKEFDDMNINIIQTIVSENTIYIRLDIEGKNKLNYISGAFLSKGNTFDENIVGITKDEDGFVEYYINDDYTHGASLQLLDDLANNNSLISSYLLSFDYSDSSNINNGVLRLYFDEDAYHDISLNIMQNEINTKKLSIEKTIYNKNNLVMKTNSISVSTYSVTINYDVNEPKILDDFEEYGEQFENITINYKNGTSENLYIIISYTENNDGTYTSAFGYYESGFINIENVKSVTINDTIFEI